MSRKVVVQLLILAGIVGAGAFGESHCDVEDVIRENNTLLMFAPMSMPPSLHAVKLDYDDLKSQRTQVYGNLFFLT